MKTNITYKRSRYVLMACSSLMCMFYLLGLFQNPVLELLHEAAHIFSSKNHHHNFFEDHESHNSSSLEAQTGHSHEALEGLKELLEINSQKDHDSEITKDFKFDKHVTSDIDIAIQHTPINSVKKRWVYCLMISKWYPSNHLPPPRSI